MAVNPVLRLLQCLDDYRLNTTVRKKFSRSPIHLFVVIILDSNWPWFYNLCVNSKHCSNFCVELCSFALCVVQWRDDKVMTDCPHVLTLQINCSLLVIVYWQEGKWMQQLLKTIKKERIYIYEFDFTNMVTTKASGLFFCMAINIHTYTHMRARTHKHTHTHTYTKQTPVCMLPVKINGSKKANHIIMHGSLSVCLFRISS